MALLGRCSWCEEIRQVYEQEDERRVIFLICRTCISDVILSWEKLQSYFRTIKGDDGSYFPGHKGA